MTRKELELLAAEPLDAPATAVARWLGLSGPVVTVSSACASGTQALGAALDALRAGEVDVALAGGADSLCRLTYAGFNALRVVDERACRPFRAGREGMTLGEGAGVLVVEPEERAVGRRARILGAVLGAGNSCDAHHMTAPHPEGVGAALAIGRALRDAGLDPMDAVIAFVNAHGTGTPLNDLSEWRGMARLLGERAGAIPLTATKASVGHLLGSSGAIEAVATLLCLSEGVVHPTPSAGEGDGGIDPETPIRLVLDEPLRLEPGADPAAVALSTSFGFGGANAAAVFAPAGTGREVGGRRSKAPAIVRGRAPASVRVVVTGLGAVGAWGAGRQDLASALATGRPQLSPLAAPGPLAERRRLLLRPGAAWAGQVAADSLAPWLPGAAARRMSRPSRMAVATARMALADAGLATDHAGGGGDGSWQGVPPEVVESAAVVLATAYGPSSVSEELEEQILLQGPEAASPALFAESVANAPAAQVARITGARGANLTVTAREAGPLLAVRQATSELAAGRSAVALAGGVDEITPLLQAVLDRFGALAHGSRAGEPPVARPFDRRRRGFVTGEGAAMVVLETEEAASRRGAEPLALVSGCGAAFDSTAPRHGWGTGSAVLGAALRRTLERAGVAVSEMDLVVSGAMGSVTGDRLTARTLLAAWGGAPLPPVVAPKGVVGELGGGLLAAGVLAASGVEPGPTAGLREEDPDLGVAPWRGGALPRPVRRVLLVDLAPGGTSAWVVLEAAR